VAIVTPNHLHHPMAMAFLDAGIHVICDKPLATTVEEALDLVQKVRASGLLFALTHNYTGFPLVRQAREMVALAPDIILANGTPVIVIATTLPSFDIVKVLIEAGARADEKSKDESTALTVAAANGNTDIVSYLLEHGADVDETGSLREPALIKAARARHNAVLKILIAHKADLTATDGTGATALEIAERSGWTDTVDLLKKAGTK
jgi:hypothetical protein